MSRRESIAFASVTTLFFAWGFISSNNDPLLVSLRAIFGLSYTDALATQLVFFVGYGLMSLPAASIGNRFGPVNTILGALATMAAGCLLLGVAARADAYPPILAALFVLAIGITTLQVATNPLTAALGAPESSHFRLTLAQAINSLGVVVGVHYGALAMLGGPGLRHAQAAVPDAAQRALALGEVVHAYRILALVLVLLLAFIWIQRRRIACAVVGAVSVPDAPVLAALKSRWAVFGAVAIGLYVGAEVSIGSIMINFLGQPGTLDLPLADGGRYLANFYWGGALVGRFLGTLLLTRIPAARLLASCGLTAAALCLVVAVGSGPVAGYAALAIGLFNSVMFPTIFTLTLERAGVSRASTSGLLFLAISGGALLPLLVGLAADTAGLNAAFGIPLVGYVVIAAFGMLASRRSAVTPISSTI